ncbi:sensor histidine kinase [Atopobacter phocae]|uniref:sensor histidine kinase n=1 Tax=Atopobacter phocae TaxID=136492 RepID=UPI0004700EB9|nr:ATP-binding protein [Atopobacter phocae]
MEKIINKIKGLYIGIIMAIFHHLLIGLYMWKITNSSLYESKNLVILLCVFFLQITLYVVSFIRSENKRLLSYLSATIVAVSWQFLSSISSSDSYQLFLNSLTPIGLFLLVFSSVSLITIGQESIFKELFQVVGGLVLLSSVVSILSSNPLFTLFTSSFILLSPIILLFMYKKEIRHLSKSVRNRLKIFTLLSLALLIVIFWTSFPPLAWFLSLCILMLILHFKIIIDIMQRKISRIKEIYIQLAIKIMVTIFVVIICMSVILQFDNQSNYILINGMALLLSLVGLEVVYFLESPKYDEENKQLKAILMRKNTIVKELLEDELNKQVFSEYLHNEILQNVIAIKNLSSYSDQVDFRNEILSISQDMIHSIRVTLDSYQPALDKKLTLIDNYKRLINRVKTNQAFNGSLEVDLPSELYLPRPYDLLMYRFLEELLINACKYGKNNISLKVIFKNQMINLIINNDILIKEQLVESSGHGLDFINKRLQVLGGEMTIKEDANKFNVILKLPIEKEFCYEDFIN